MHSLGLIGITVIRLAITLSEPRYRALKKAASLRGRTSGQLIDKSLDFYGVNSREEAIELVRRARASRGWMKFKPYRLRLARFNRHVALTNRDDLMLVTGGKLLQQAGLLQQRVKTPQVFVAQALE